MDKKSITQHIKQRIKKLPIKYPGQSTEEFEKFIGFFTAIKEIYKTGEKFEGDPFAKLFYHLEMIWSHLLTQFINPQWLYDHNGYNENLRIKYQSERIDVIKLIELVGQAAKDHELESFFQAYPYVNDLLKFTQYLQKDNKSIEDSKNFNDLVTEYLYTIELYNCLMPILVLKEHLNLMLGNADFDIDFYKTYMTGSEDCLSNRDNQENNILFLSCYIKNNIPYSLKKSHGYKKLNWDAFKGISKNYKSVDKAKFQQITLSLKKFIEELMEFQLCNLKEQDIMEVDLSYIESITIEGNTKPALKISMHYIDIVNQVQISDDSNINRLAILRTITAIGEALNSIKLLIPEKYFLQDLEVSIQLRDYIVHSTTFTTSKFLENIINNPDDKTLAGILLEIKNFGKFFKELEIWLSSSRLNDSFPNIPTTVYLKEFKKLYENAKIKDDRDEKLSLADYSNLEKSIPKEDEKHNSDYAKIEDFIRNGTRLNKNEFIEACIVHSAGYCKDIHEKRIEQNKISSIRESVANVSIDFSKIPLNVKKEFLDKIKEDKNLQNLEKLLDEHQEKNNFDKDKFLASVRVINLKSYKEKLNNFIEGKFIDKEDFNKTLKIVFSSDFESIQKWKDAYNKRSGEIESFKREQCTQLKYLIDNTKLIKSTSEKIFNGKHLEIGKDPIISIACEMLYGICANSFREIKKSVSKLYDYTDKSLYFFTFTHPIEEVEQTMDSCITTRNHLFHFEQVFSGCHGIVSWRNICFSNIQYLTHGMFFPNAKIVTSNGIHEQSRFTKSHLQKLIDFLQTLQNDLSNDPNKLNIYNIIVKDLPTSGNLSLTISLNDDKTVDKLDINCTASVSEEIKLSLSNTNSNQETELLNNHAVDVAGEVTNIL